MISNSVNSTQTVRNVFIIDNNGIVRTILIYPMNIGRFIPEILRIIKALQTANCNNGATPANWIPNDPIIQLAPKTYEELEKRKQEILENKNGISWYLSYKEPTKECIEKTKQIEN